MTDRDYATVAELLAAAGVDHDSRDFRRVASMRSLYHWNADANQGTDGSADRIANMPKLKRAGVRPQHNPHIQHAPRGLYEIRGMGAKRKLPHFDDLLSSRRRCRAIRWKAIASAARRRRSGEPVCEKPIELAIPSRSPG
jgi:hypothetical protein